MSQPNKIYKHSRLFGILCVVMIIGGLGYGLWELIFPLDYSPTSKALSTTDLFLQGDSGYHSFRIPAIVRGENQTLFAFCEARKDNASDFGNIDLVMRRSTDGGISWESMVVIWDNGSYAVQNPCPIYIPQTRTLLLHVIVDRQLHFVLQSTDQGVTWSQPREISNLRDSNWVFAGPAPGHGILTSTNRIIIPGMYYLNTSTDNTKEEYWGSYLMYSDDFGQTYSRGMVFPNGTNECLVTETSNGSVLTILRPNTSTLTTKFVQTSYSGDFGLNSTPSQYNTQLVSPICQSSIIQCTNAKNASFNGLYWAGPYNSDSRINLTIRFSVDNGVSWSNSMVVFEGKAGYSDLVLLPDDVIGVLFERGREVYREKITFCTIPLSAV
jgi:sialidase-1